MRKARMSKRELRQSATVKAEPKYEDIYATTRFKMGLISGYDYLGDPKHIIFGLSRYKFVSKMFSGLSNVLEIGCGDGFGTPIVFKEVKKLVACDYDKKFIDDVNQTHPYARKIDFIVHDITKSPVAHKKFDGAFSLDVLEHIDKNHEIDFMKNIVAGLKDDGVCIVGIPSLESQQYASPLSKLGHINCKTWIELKQLLEKFFGRVFIFSMNDEVVHTGYYPMAHYLFALCLMPRKVSR